MVNPKNEIGEDYVKEMVSHLNFDVHLIDECEIYNTTTFGWRIKLKTKNKNLYFLEISLHTYNKAKHLFIHIEPQKITDEFDKDLYDVKLHIKNSFRKDWDECIWLEDEQSNLFADQLYSAIHKTENHLRQLINIVMIRNFGVKWWDKFVPFKVQNKYKARFSSYKRVAQAYANVSDHLLSIDTDDLLEIMTHKIMKFSPKNEHVVINLLDSLREVADLPTVAAEYKNAIDKLKSECEVEVDLWQTLFGKLFPESFQIDWEDFSKNRNHVAHNKLIDLNAFNIINKNIEGIQKYISDAEKKFKRTNLSEEEKELEFELEEAMRADLELMMLERMESEANISILSSTDIFEIFDEHVSSFIESIKDSIYFREDLNIDTKDLIENEDKQELFSAESKITNNLIKIHATLDLNEEAAQESTVRLDIISNDELVDTCELSYTNGGAELDEENGYYMPTAYNEFNGGHLEDFEATVYATIEEVLPNLVKVVDLAKSQAQAVGNQYPVADSECEECGEQYICIDESICKVGTCVNCGYENELDECERCHKLYNSTTEGEESFCGECTNYIERQD